MHYLEVVFPDAATPNDCDAPLPKLERETTVAMALKLRLLTVDQLAKAWDVTPRTIFRWVENVPDSEIEAAKVRRILGMD